MTQVEMLEFVEAEMQNLRDQLSRMGEMRRKLKSEITQTATPVAPCGVASQTRDQCRDYPEGHLTQRRQGV